MMPPITDTFEAVMETTRQRPMSPAEALLLLSIARQMAALARPLNPLLIDSREHQPEEVLHV